MKAAPNSSCFGRFYSRPAGAFQKWLEKMDTGDVYGYVPQSSLVQSIAFASGGSNTMTTTKSYDYLDRLGSIASSAAGTSGTPDLSAAYAYNAANQRMACALGDGSYWSYGYDALGQVTSGQKLFPNGSAVPGEQYGYGYDGIGNRSSTTVNGRPASYSPNQLNQYTARDVPGAVDVLGSANSAAQVTVNDQAVSRSGTAGLFYTALPVKNSAAPVLQSVKVVGVKGSGSAAGQDIVSEQNGNLYLAQTPEQFNYDLDGNLTQDGRWTYTWDGENRLIAIQSNSPVPAAAKKQLQFTYDYMGRRVQKQVYTWNAASGSYQFSTETQYLYDGWNCIAEIDGSGNLVRSYLWGADLSGSLAGAGGVGGLLAITDHTGGRNAGAYLVSYDGNGNLTALINGTSGAVMADYQYGPFGEVVRASGPMAGTNPFQFSTKYTDAETALNYYGYRYYNPSTGRWLSRDPIADRAFLRQHGQGMSRRWWRCAYREGLMPLYLFNRNDPLRFVDPLGLTCLSSISVLFYNSDTVPDSPPRGDDGHIDKSSGRQFSGYLRAYDKDGHDVVDANVISGGNRDPNSRVNQGDDTSIPSGSYTVNTFINGTIGYVINGVANRGDMEIHYNGVTTGCIAMTENWSSFVQDMNDTNKKCCTKKIPLSVSYNMSDGTPPPHGNSGGGSGDPGGGPGPWPDPDPR